MTQGANKACNGFIGLRALSKAGAIVDAAEWFFRVVAS